jgi:hypothetical protein
VKSLGALRAIPILVVVLQGNIVLGNLASAYFSLVGVGGILHALYDARFKRLAFFQQLSGTLRIRTFHWREAAVIAPSAPR